MFHFSVALCLIAVMSFADEIIEQYKAEFPTKGSLYDRYFIWNKNLPNAQDVGGCSSLYRFVDPTMGKAWVEIYDLVSMEITKRISEEYLSLVPFYLKDAEVLIQSKAPYDGGYSMSRYHEFLTVGSCRPNSDILKDVARVLTVIDQCDWRFDQNEDTQSGIIQNVIHQSLIGPNSDMMWHDDGKWLLYMPAIKEDQVDTWRRLDMGSGPFL